MVLFEDSIWILTALELDLCLHILGGRYPSVLPVAESSTPLDQRMLNGFVHLAELGLLCAADDGYQPTQLMRNRLQPIASPKYVVTLTGSRLPLLIFGAQADMVLLEPLGDDAQRCALSVTSPAELESALEAWCAAEDGGALILEIFNADDLPVASETIPGDQIGTAAARIRELLAQTFEGPLSDLGSTL